MSAEFGFQKRSEKLASLSDNPAPSTKTIVADYNTELHDKCKQSAILVDQAISEWQAHYRVKNFDTPENWRFWHPYFVVCDKDGFRPHAVVPPDDLVDVFVTARELQFSVFDLQMLLTPFSSQTERVIQHLRRAA